MIGWLYFSSQKNGIPEKQDAGPWEDPGPYEEPGNYEEPGPYVNPGSYEDSEFFDDPEKTQELINELKFLDFHIMCLIWWNLQLKADLFVIAECR